MEENTKTERFHWIASVLCAVVIAFVLWDHFGISAAAAEIGIVITVLLISGVFRSKPCLKGEQPLDVLVESIDEYSKQRHARRLQRPWLVVSLLAYATGYITIILGHGQDAKFLCWGVAAALLAALVSMAVAGVVAESDPPAEGKERILGLIGRYKPHCADAYLELRQKIHAGAWKVEDLVAFVTVEEKERNLQGRIEEDIKLLHKP